MGIWGKGRQKSHLVITLKQNHSYSLVSASNATKVQATLARHKRMEPGCTGQSLEDTGFYSGNNCQAGLNDNKILYCGHMESPIMGNIHCISFCLWMFYIG